LSEAGAAGAAADASSRDSTVRDEAGDAPPSIRTRGLRKVFRTGERTVEALRGVDLEIPEPCFHAVMGASGSGKSTLLHLLAGLDRADAGEIEVGGRRVDRMSEADLTLYRRRAVGVVFQAFNLLPTLTALENAAMPGVLDGRPRAECSERAALLLRELGLGDRFDHRPDALSGGEQQRVAIARALHFSPGVLFADEPTGNLDSASSERLFELLGGIAAERRMIVLVVTHEANAAVRCAAATILRDGAVAGGFTTEGLDADDLAARAAELARPAR